VTPHEFPAGSFHVGNAGNSAGARGWILGHFVADESDVRHTKDVEVKWSEHPAGDHRDGWVTGETRTTLLLLVKGHFHITLSTGAYELIKPGDYAVWGPGIDHIWRAEVDSIVVTVRWPSRS